MKESAEKTAVILENKRREILLMGFQLRVDRPTRRCSALPGASVVHYAMGRQDVDRGIILAPEG